MSQDDSLAAVKLPLAGLQSFCIEQKLQPCHEHVKTSEHLV